MTKPSPRRLTLADLAIVIAGSAIAFLLVRIVHQAGTSNSAIYLAGGFSVYLYVTPFLLMGALALIVVRFVEPRPRFRVIIRQPGTIGCLAFLLSFAFNGLISSAVVFVQQLMGQPTYIPIDDIRFWLLNCINGGPVMATAWITLAATRRWRPEPSWIDRSGRVLVVVAFLAEMTFRLIP